MLLKKFIFIAILIPFISTLSHAKTLRILPLGDSLTYDNNHHDIDVKPRPISKRYAYRGPLWKMLKDAKINFDFVGTKKAGRDYAPDFDPDNDGFPGETSFAIAEQTYDILKATQPDIILLHAGANDHGAKMEGMDKILEMIDIYEETNNKEVRVFVALIVDRREPDTQIKYFNLNLAKLIKRRWEKGDILTQVDMYRKAGLTKKDYIDRTHPNARGYTKMAKMWFNALKKPYVPFSTAPITQNDKIEAETSATVSINVLNNDKDYQNDMEISSVKFENNSTKLYVTGEGTWKVNSKGIVTFTPNGNFTADPTPIKYSVADKEGTVSQFATIIINYTNASLENYPTSIVPKKYIESVTIDESTNSVTFIATVPNTGIAF